MEFIFNYLSTSARNASRSSDYSVLTNCLCSESRVLHRGANRNIQTDDLILLRLDTTHHTDKSGNFLVGASDGWRITQ